MHNLLLQIATAVNPNEGLESLIKISTKFGIRYLIDFISVFLLIRGVYFSKYQRNELFFTFFIFNLVIFLICFLLNKVELSMGAAFGLFAVFSMLRYRTEDISLKDMTYLFLVIAMGLIAAVTKIKDAEDMYEYFFLILVNGLLITVTWLMEGTIFMRTEMVKVIFYDNIELIKKEHEAALLADIILRTGINVHRIQVQKIDFLRDEATIRIFYYE